MTTVSVGSLFKALKEHGFKDDDVITFGLTETAGEKFGKTLEIDFVATQTYGIEGEKAKFYSLLFDLSEVEE